jgi:hypothetical protein
VIFTISGCFFSLVIAAAASVIRISTWDAFVCAAIGIGAHFFEDALIADPAYRFFWPVSLQKFGIGILYETRNIFGIANSEVLLIGILLLSGATVCTDADLWERMVECIPARRDPENEMNSTNFGPKNETTLR